jgi:DNA-directed RNA polymerase subunit RPC12/RpoP
MLLSRQTAVFNTKRKEISMSGMSPGLTQRAQTSKELTLRQRFALRCRASRQLLLLLFRERYTPTGTCGKCGYELVPAQIIAGFKSDSDDLTIPCPRCGSRFVPDLFVESKKTSCEVIFMCPSQTLVQLSSFGVTVPEQYMTGYPSLYRSALYNFGSLHGAFRHLGIRYMYMESFQHDSGRVRKVKHLLGRLPDTVIAEALCRSIGAVRAMRRRRGIAPYRRIR